MGVFIFVEVYYTKSGNARCYALGHYYDYIYIDELSSWESVEQGR